MQKRASIWLGAAVAMAMALPAAAQDVDASTILATVNGENITLGHMIATRLALPDQYQALPDKVLFDGLLEQLIQQTVLGQAMGEISKSTQLQLENERRALVAGQVLDNVIAGAVTDEALQAAYDAEFANAEPTKEYNASHILVETEDAAKALIAELENGGDFAALAMEHSTGPSGPNGGELGWFSEGMMVKPFEDAVLALEVGQISPPVETQFGWHVVILNETRMQGAPALEDVRDELVARIENDAVEKAVQDLMDAATIERKNLEGLDPALVREDVLLD